MGCPLITWQAQASPTLGTAMGFYRIYRDGTEYSNRYDTTGDGVTLSYTDRTRAPAATPITSPLSTPTSASLRPRDRYT